MDDFVKSLLKEWNLQCLENKFAGGIPTIHPLPLALYGIKAAEGQFPYLVSIQIKKRHICGGSIINKNWILTAAHCVSFGGVQAELKELQILAGTNHLNKGGIRYNVSKIIVHDNYNLHNYRNDIALLRVEKNILFNKSISSIPLASEEPLANEIVISGGWGDSSFSGKAINDLQFLELFAVPTTMCIDNNRYFQIFDNNTCAQPLKFEAGLCFGESGGPLIYKEKVVGVFSWLTICGSPLPVVFSKVTSFEDWIKYVIKAKVINMS